VTQIFQKNLASLRREDADLAAKLEATAPAPVRTVASRAGPIVGTIDHEGRSLALASRYDPMAEARRLVEAFDPARHACAVVLGMGMGHHISELIRRAASSTSSTILIVYEPSLPMLRAALEIVDHHSWLGKPNVIIAHQDTDRAALLGRLERFGGLMTQGTILLTHPPSRQMHARKLAEFGKMVGEALAYCRTNVATTLVNSARTCRNLTFNLGHYVGGATTDELHNAAAGIPAVCVGAGPSLARNVDLLADPALRANVVLISAQTTLKPLLQRGIEPDFVTALDYHEISKRFYEGIGELPNVTLVAEPLANAAILESYPGPIRLTQSGFLDRLLGAQARPRVPVTPGATVAHLSFYLAQHLGCDPIILIGQDLGFTNGLYYCPGTAIHDVWAPELGPFNTLEMMEWQRIVRHRNHLHKLEDVQGHPIYSDEQMVTYLKQFERDFARSAQQVIDATEGGVPKKHTSRSTLADALAQFATRPAPRLPLPRGSLDQARLASASELLARRMEQIAQMRGAASKVCRILRQMREHQRDKARMDRLFEQVEATKKKVHELDGVFDLVNQLNAIGAFRRARADRAIEHAEGDAFERQLLQIDRDQENMQFLIEACEEASGIFGISRQRLAKMRKMAAGGRRHEAA
jgi:hypothetical protein